MSAFQIIIFIILIIASYFIGNLSPSRILASKENIDITKQGSGNPGMTNMLRTFGFKMGLLTLVLDALKGAIPAAAGFFIFGGTGGGALAYIALYSAGLAAVLGHNFPILYNFKGGKGIACMLGIFLVAHPLITLIVLVGVFFYLLLFDYGAIGSFILITSLTLFEAYRINVVHYATTETLILKILLFVLFFLAWFMHRQNIFRLLIGKENKINLMDKLKNIGGKKSRQKRKEKKEEEIG